MAKSKYAPALFEVIDSHAKGKKKDSLALPKWWKNSTKEKESTAEQEHPAEPSTEEPVSKVGEAGSATEEMPAAGKTVTEAEASVPREGGSSAPAVTGLQGKPSAAPAMRTGGATPEASARDTFPRAPLSCAVETGRASGRDRSGSGLADQRSWTRLWERVVRVEEGRIEFSLTPVNLSFVCGGVLIALFAAFLLGTSVHRTPADDGAKAGAQDPLGLESVRNSTPDPSVLGGAASGDRAPGERAERPLQASEQGASSDGEEAAASGSRSGRQVGLNYVILQYFYEGDRKDALQAQKWLASKGVDTTLERSVVNNGWLLISTRGFDYHEPNGKEAAERFRDRIIQLGKAYHDEFGAEARYDFHDPMIRKEQ